MKGKVLFVVGLGVGYVLGTRAGRQRYEQIKSAWLKVWDAPVVQKQVHAAQDYAADRIGDLGTVVTDSIKRAVTKSNGSGSKASTAAGKDDATSSATAKSTSAKSTSAKPGSRSKTGTSKTGGSRRGSSGSGGARSGGAGSGGQES